MGFFGSGVCLSLVSPCVLHVSSCPLFIFYVSYELLIQVRIFEVFTSTFLRSSIVVIPIGFMPNASPVT